MHRAIFRFYAELNEFLLPERRFVAFEHQFSGTPSVKDQIEALGVPHPEVDLILANGESVDFAYRLQPGDRIAVYPVFETLDIHPILRVRPEPLREIRFVLDCHLGRLAKYLRLLGFDVLYRPDFHDPELAQISRDERRILLTRDRGLLKRGSVTHGYCLRETDPLRQTVEVVRRFDLYRLVRPFHRCLRCNAVLKPVEQEAVCAEVPPGVLELRREFFRCLGCRRVYWKGTHYERLDALVQSLLSDERRQETR